MTEASTTAPAGAPTPPAQGSTAAPAAPGAEGTTAAPAAAPATAAPLDKAFAPASEPSTTEPPKPPEGHAFDGWQETGNPKLDMTLKFLSQNGFQHDSPAVQAAANGDFSILRAELAAKGVAGADAYLALGEAAYNEFKSADEARAKADQDAVHKLVGGQENWTAISEWAGANADETEKPALREMLGKGGQFAIIAAGYLAGQYMRATGGVPETEGSGASAASYAGSASLQTDALDARAYAKAVIDARAKHNPRNGTFEESPEYAKLRDRRSRHRG